MTEMVRKMSTVD